MGLCNSKPYSNPTRSSRNFDPHGNSSTANNNDGAGAHSSSVNGGNPSADAPNDGVKRSPFFPFYTPSPAHYWFSKKSPAARSPATSDSTPRRFFKRPFPPPSPAKHIRAVLARRHGSVKPNEATIPEGSEADEVVALDKNFGFSKHFGNKFEVGSEVGRGHFGYTCAAKFKKGELKGQQVAVKVIPKAKMTTAIAIEDVRREVKILRALTGHKNLVQFYDAYEDHDNVYIVMELCEGGELLDRILSRGGKYTEEDAKAVLRQILNVVAFCHLQGVVHRDLKPENFLFTSKDDNSELKAIDFGLSDFVKPGHPWIKSNKDVKVPLDILIFKLMKAYMRSSSLRKAALRALSKTLTVDELFYLKEQFTLLEPNKNGTISLENIKAALVKNATDAMKESRIPDFLGSLNALQYRRMDFDEFCAATLSVHQLEALDRWEQHARCAYELFEKDGNRAIVIEELASELGLGPSVPVHAVLHDWIRHTDGKLSFLGFVKLLHGPSRSLVKAQ
ncbi:CDPK-related kinase 5 isoform X2 [Arachis ipaensis]|uniref:CDPK-related kinase 5 isoform X2 n=1 Tax=Arachis ipaensis TaxID=130454 RepID=UPI000A2B5825|nr:CDPK-related kinase 5 isoform X2 [Arachis ipaensis]XP_025652743.1 CDPK-related kinase 5 isoform X2 [Arachis hypogaea]XP_025698724.1 CDPK-related kinase 5 isoform X2 [Arachis hypogaea]